MLVFWKQRLVYLATPKTGTTAIEAALEPLASVVIQRPPELKHTSVHRYWKYLAPFLQKAADEDFMVVAVMLFAIGNAFDIASRSTGSEAGIATGNGQAGWRRRRARRG